MLLFFPIIQYYLYGMIWEAYDKKITQQNYRKSIYLIIFPMDKNYSIINLKVAQFIIHSYQIVYQMLKFPLGMKGFLSQLLTLLSLIFLSQSSTVPLTFVSTIAGTFQAGSIVLTQTTPTTVGGFSSISTTLTYLNTYTSIPLFGYGLSYMYSQFPTTVSANEVLFNVSSTSSSQVMQTIQLNFTANAISLFSINYLICSSSFFLDIRTFQQDLTGSNLNVTNLPTSRSLTLNLPMKGKSNSSNTASVYTTVGIGMMRAKNTFQFQLATIGFTSSTILVNLTVMGNNGMRFIRFMIFNYETFITTVSPPFYFDMGVGTNLGGTVPDSSGLSLTTTGTIFMGMVDWALVDSATILQYNMSLSRNIYSLISGAVTRTQTAYIWYRQAVCPTSYYNLSNLCYPCHYSCLTCMSGTATGCTSCESTNFRTFLSSNFSCPCQSKYIDTGSAVCQQLLCYEFCTTCSANYVCSACNSGTYRSLSAGKCACAAYTVDKYDYVTIPTNSMYSTCQLCHPTCLTCFDMFFRDACESCSLSRDKRSYNALTSTCDCIDGFFQVPNLTRIVSNYYYVGVPCLACHYSCATCTGNTSCLSCNASLNRVYNSTSRLCSCSSGFYDNNLVQSCFSCPYSCATCTSPTLCQTCQSNRILTNNLCPCVTGFYDSGVAACLRCNYTCLTCSSSSSCTTCNSADFRSLSNGSCLCADRTYDTLVSATCAACHYTCFTCTGAAANTCTSCSSNLYRTLTTNKTCDCMNGYYLDGSGTCTPCPYSCATCSDAATCTSCNGTLFRYLSGSSCLCNNKYYDDGGNQLCKTCMYFCLTCSSSSSCTTCHSSRNSSDLATCTCLSGFYDDGVNSYCPQCLASCLTCNNPTNCSSCAVNRVLTLLASCVCMTRTFEPYCNSCHYSCLECLGINTNCTSCNGTSLRYLDAVTARCLCYQGFYDDSSNQLCQPCHFSCLTCSTGSSCLTCHVNRVLNGSLCSCISNYYQNSQNSSNCLPCHYSCLTCSSFSVCSTCDANSSRMLSPNSTLCVCANGYFDNLVSAPCIQCYSICLTCSSYFTCTSCNSTLNFYLSNGTCLCNTGFYFDSTTKSCIACHYSCNTCSSGSACISCKQNRTLSGNQCPCDSGLFDNSQTQTCSLCTYPCITCTTSSSFCTSCDNSTRTLIVSSGRCVCFGSTYDTGLSCSNCLSTCQTCTSGAACTTCLAGSSRVLNNNSLCVCPTGFHDENGTVLNCSQCHYSCTSCLNSISCSTCYTRRTSIVGGYCACPPEYFYDNGVNADCIPCEYNCFTCSMISTNCTSCLSSTFRTLINGSCTCIEGYYDDFTSANCIACHYSCQRCTSGASCTACNATNFRIFGNGTYCTCMNGYYDVSNIQMCSPCAPACLTCISTATTCRTCPNSRTFVNTSSSCLCNDGYYDAGVAVCLACHYSCATCTNATTCLTCPTNRTKNNFELCICNPGTFDTGQSSSCTACAPTCLQCSAYQTCTLCNTAVNFRQLVNSSCVCPAGYYDASFSLNYTCQRCPYSCSTCVSGSQCTSCSINFKRTYNISTGLCSCVSGFFDDGFSGPCQLCLTECATCSNNNTCLTCPSIRYLGSDSRCYCINATYADGTSCESCPIQCLTCQNTSYCLSCASNRVLLNNACVCSSGLYTVAGNATCLSCHYSCATCLTGSQCSTCNSTLNRYLTSTFCLCSTGFYDDGQNQTCKACSYSCLMCANGNTCLSCNPLNNRIINNVTALCDCASGYYEDPTTKACIQCHVSCVTCTNGSACTSCNSNFKRQLDASNQCTCLSIGFFDTFISPICSACHYTCLSCSGSATYCTACGNNTMRSLSSSSCLCSNGYYDVLNQVICLTCSVRCVTCLGSSDNCTQCSAANFRAITPNCSCITGYYDNSSAVCAACNYRCLTCTMSEACSTCDLNISKRSLNPLSRLCDCIAQFYDVGVNICIACNYACLTCNAAATCLTCPSTRVLTVSQCPCLPKHYDDLQSLDCIPCDYTCQSCRNGTACFSCDASLMRTFNSSTFRCSCMVGYFDVGVQACSKCDSSCQTCTNAAACLTCPPNINKTLNSSFGSNFCVCLYGYYQNTTAGALLGYNSVCSPCYFACQTCANQATYCTLCLNSSNRYLTASHQCACIVGTFQIFGQQTCISCAANCLTCTGTASNACLTCDNTTYFLNSSCYTSCPQFYNISVSTRTCVSCSSNCLSCPTSFTVCSQCNSPFFIFSYNSSYSVCVNSCPSYYYQINSTCFPCLSPCLSCTAAYVCTSCINLYYLSNGNCNPCHALCLTCSGSTALDCITCVPNYILKGSVCQKLSCLPNQYVQSVAGCVNCSTSFPNSLTCLSTGPTSCVDGYILSNSSCLTCSSVTGYTYNTATGKCQDYCGDRIIITDLCDDGNNLNGDGCSSVCTIQSGWTCPSNNCILRIQPTVSVISMSNSPISHTITLVISLSVGLRLVAANFLLTFSEITQFTYSVSALDVQYKTYQLRIVYFQTAANNRLKIQIKSPVSRLLQTTNSTSLSLSISLSLSVTVPVVTNPPAIFVPQQTSQVYSKYLFAVMASLHVILLIVAFVFLAMRLKVMLLVIDAFNSVTILYILAGLGMYGVSLVSFESMRGLQPFVYSFGSALQTSNSLSYFGYSSNFFGTCIIQAAIISVCFLLSAYFSKKDPSGEDNPWHYYRVGFAFSFSYDILLSCFSTFFWDKYTSYQASYSWMFALLFIIYLCAQAVVYLAKMRESNREGKKVVPAVSFITNDLEIKDRVKDVNIFEFQEEAVKSKKKGMLSELSDQQTEVIQGAEIGSKKEEIVNYYDLTPSAQTQYSISNSNHISALHLPLISLLFPLLFAIIVNIENSVIRSALFLVLSIFYCLTIIGTKNSSLKSFRNMKLLISSLLYFIISAISLGISSNSSADLIKIDMAIVALVIAAMLFNVFALIAGVLRSEAYREYQINRKNQAIMQRTKKQNETRMKIYTKNQSKDSNKPIKPNNTQLNIFLSEPQSFQVRHHPHPDIQISEQQVEQKEIKLSALKKRPRDEPTMMQVNSSSINQHIDQQVSDFNNSDFRAPSELLNDKQLLQGGKKSAQPRSPSKKQGNRIKAINSSEMSLVSRKGETPSLFFENSLERIDEIKGVKRNLNKTEEKEEVEAMKRKPKKKKRPNVETDVIAQEQYPQAKVEKPRESEEVLEGILDEMDMPKGFKKPEDSSFRARIMSIDDISSIHQQREQFAMQEREEQYQGSVFNKILQDYQKYKFKKVDKKKLKQKKPKK